MKSFRKLVSEVAQPTSGDELNFKEKHIIDHILDPNSEEEQFTADDIKRATRRADYTDGDDAEVYEGVTLTRRPLPGQEEDDMDSDGDEDMADAQLRYRRHAQIKNKIIDEDKGLDESEMTPAQIKKREEIVMAMKKNAPELKKQYGDDWKAVMYATATKQAMSEALDDVGCEDEDINNDGKVDKTDAYLRARRAAIAKKLRKEGLEDVLQPITRDKKKIVDEGIDPIEPVGGEYDQSVSHSDYKDKNKKNLVGASVKGEVDEDVSLVKPKKGLRVYAGKTKESQIAESYDLSTEDAHYIQRMYEELDENNLVMMKEIIDAGGINDIVQFAKGHYNG